MEVTLNLPDDLARRAQSEGLLSAEAVQRMPEDAMRRAAGQKLLNVAGQIHAAGIEPMSDEELQPRFGPTGRTRALKVCSEADA